MKATKHVELKAMTMAIHLSTPCPVHTCSSLRLHLSCNSLPLFLPTFQSPDISTVNIKIVIRPSSISYLHATASSTMSFKDSTTALEMPLDLSEYVNFDFDVDAVDSLKESSNLVATAIQNTYVDGPYVEGSGVLDSGTQGFETTHSFGNPVEIGSPFSDFTILSPVSEGSYMTDSFFQTPIEPNASRNDFSVFEPVVFADSVEPAALETPRSPSRWVPASPGLQKHLNRVYAPQLAQLAADPNPPPVLYFPAEGGPILPMPSTRSPPTDDLARTGFPQTPQINAESLLIDPSLLIPSKISGSVSLPLSNGKQHLMSRISDASVPVAEGQTLTPTNKRASDAKDSDCEPAPKRTMTAKPLPIAVKNTTSADDQGAVVTPAKSTRQISSPDIAVDKDPNDETDAEGEDDPDHHNPSPKQGPHWRHEQTPEICLRDQRLKEWNRRRASSIKAKGKTSNRKMQKMLSEIEDTKEFAAVQGREGEENAGGDGGRRRPVRKGARKNYAGQQ